MTDHSPQKYSRRYFLRLATTGVVGFGVINIGGMTWATQIEPYRLTVTQVTIPLPNLPPAFAGFTIAQISDLHITDGLGPEWMQTVVQNVNALQPDLIAITGDFVTFIGPDTATQLTDILRELNAPAGVVAVLGNHDYWTHAPTVRAAVQRAGILLLDNTHMAIQRNGAALYVLGVDDIWEHKHDLSAALAGVPVDTPTVLLAHEPDYADTTAATGRIGLQLSGHSHGGQVRLPGRGAIVLPPLGEFYDHGLYRINNMHLYVNRGVGMIAPHVRLNCPPEITLLTLTT
ncbi:metallophosphoesterase, partial [Chloroflexota bacterium]